MPWNDSVFRQLVEEAAHRIGNSRTQVLIESGISRSTINQIPRHGRSVDLIERLMPVLKWTPADALDVIAKSFGWQDVVATVPPSPAQEKPGLRETLADIATAALQLRSQVKNDDAVTLDTALAFVGEVVRARTCEDRA